LALWSETLYSEAGMTAYNEHLKKYLAEAVPSTTTLPGLFQKSLIARVLYADQMNQHGQADDVKDLVDKQSASGRDFGRCDNITVAENEILARVIWKDPSDHTIGKRPFSNRYKTIQRIVRANAVNGGLSGCV